MTEKVHAPAEIPPEYVEAIATIDPNATFQYNWHNIPYSIQARMATQRFTSLDDIAERWPDATLRNTAATDLDFDAFRTFTPVDRTFYITRLVHVVKAARQILNDSTMAGSLGTTAPLHFPGNQSPGMSSQALVNVDKQERQNLMNAWKNRASTHPAPQLWEIGSPDMVKLMKSELLGSTIPLIDIKKIVAAQPETMDRPIIKQTWKECQFGSYVQTQEESSRFPQDKDEWKKKLIIWRNTLLALMFSMPNVQEWNITKEDLDTFYTYILGREIAGRHPEVPLVTLIHGERNVWKEINIHLSEGMKLKEALITMKGNGLFWMTVLNPTSNHASYAYYGGNQGGKPSRNQKKQSKVWGGFNKQQWGGGHNMSQWPKGKGNNRGNNGGNYGGNNGGYNGGNNSYKGDYDKGGKPKGFGKGGKDKGGKGKGGNKGKDKGGKGGKPGKGKGGGKGWNPQWANKDKNGKEICRNFHLAGCQAGNNCPRAHKCPVKQGDYICLQSHRAGDCTM
jgi:hypothetical protein